MEEIWMPITETKGLYEVSSIGRIRSVSREVCFGKNKRIVHGSILKQFKKHNGYLRIILKERLLRS